MRSAVGQASGAATTAGNTASQYGADAAGIGSTLTPFLTSQLLHPQGYSQQDMTQQLNQAEAGAGGATSGVTGLAELQAARNRNPGGFTGALDQAARSRTQAAADASSGIAAKDADVKLQQQRDAATGLGSMYGQDADAQLKSMGIETGDINAEVNANNSGWLQNMNQTLQTIGKLGQGAGAMGVGFGAGQTFGG